MFKAVLPKILNFIFPEKCVFCGQDGNFVCIKCFSEIPKSESFRNNILSIYNFREDRVNKLLWRLKYHHTDTIATHFGQEVAQRLKIFLETKIHDFPDLIILVPIPLNEGDKRMINHAELVAQKISLNLQNSKVENILIKKTLNKQARTSNREERFLNIKNTISINPNYKKTKGNSVLFVLVDDVTTTGATILEARNALEKFLEIPSSQILTVTVAH